MNALQMNALQLNHIIHFYDWEGGKHQGKVKDILALKDDFGDFYLVTLEDNSGYARFEIEEFNGVLVGQPWSN
jgi:hypothetical protein